MPVQTPQVSKQTLMRAMARPSHYGPKRPERKVKGISDKWAWPVRKNAAAGARTPAALLDSRCYCNPEAPFGFPLASQTRPVKAPAWTMTVTLVSSHSPPVFELILQLFFGGLCQNSFDSET